MARERLNWTELAVHPTLLLAAAVLVVSLCASEDFIPLPTELKFSGVSVSVHAPLGRRYRPGEAFPLELHINNPGPAMVVDLLAVEGTEAGEFAERGLLPAAIDLPVGTKRVALPMRAPGVSAHVVLIVRGAASGSGRAELFRASLSGVLRPLPTTGRMIVVCGGGVAPQGPPDQTARLAARELFSEGWMWESVDWLVLHNAAILSATPEAHAALRRWLLGGGRLFLGSYEALRAALTLKLLPIEGSGDVGSDIKWWEQHAGMRRDDVLAANNFRPIFARLHHGFGQIVFRFPGSERDDADGAAVFNRPDVQRARVALPDARVQPERFAAFAQSAPSAPRRRTAMLWSLVGALILCAFLFFARTSRTKIEAALLPLGACGLLAGILAHGFPRQELTVSRVCWERVSADGAALTRDEWALLEAFRQRLETSARGPLGGTLAPRFKSLDDLRPARVDRRIDGDQAILEKVALNPNNPALLYAAAIETRPVSGRDSTEDAWTVKASETVRIPIAALNGVSHRRAVWITAGEAKLLTQQDAGSNAYNAEPVSARALEMALSEEMDASLAKARAKALGWAIDDAEKRAVGALIVWSDTPRPTAPLIAVDGAPANDGNDFLMRTIELKTTVP